MIELAEWGFDGFEPPPGASGIPARVVCAYSGYHKFVCAEGFGTARLKASGFRKTKKKLADLVRGVTLKTADAATEEQNIPPAMSVAVPTTGDWVMLDWRSSGDSRIREILPRKTALYRAEVAVGAGTGRRQILAANFDLVFLVMALDGNFSLRRLERYAVIARESGAEAAVVLTKADLAENPGAMAAAAKEAAGGIETIVSSAKDGTGFEALRGLLKPRRTFVLLGASGAGKSTILNSLAGSELMATGEVRESDSKGRHTTTRREPFKLPCGALAIDTPGVRELGLAGCVDGIDDSFEDVKAFSRLCRFNDCRHMSEPGCAVRNALENGDLSQERWAAYLKLREESENKAGEERRLPRGERPSHRWRG